jgi:hypothetical protein
MALSNKKIALLVTCVVTAIVLIFISIFATDMIFGKEGEYKYIIDIIQTLIAGGVIFGVVLIYRSFAKDLSPPSNSGEVSLQIGIPPQQQQQQSYGGMDAIFQGGVHNPFS